MTLDLNNPSHVLPALKYYISARACDSFSSPVAVVKEIKKCMGSSKLQIKFATLKDTMLIVATDDPDTHQRLNSNWPEDAFIYGIKSVTKTQKDSPRSLILKGADTSI